MGLGVTPQSSQRLRLFWLDLVLGVQGASEAELEALTGPPLGVLGVGWEAPTGPLGVLGVRWPPPGSSGGGPMPRARAGQGSGRVSGRVSGRLVPTARGSREC